MINWWRKRKRKKWIERERKRYVIRKSYYYEDKWIIEDKITRLYLCRNFVFGRHASDGLYNSEEAALSAIRFYFDVTDPTWL